MMSAVKVVRNGVMLSSMVALAATSAGAQSAHSTTPAATADSSNLAPGDIIVTARKRNERLIDVPETISALSAASLQKAGIINIDTLGQSLPNVVMNRRGDNEPNVVIRGVGSFGNVQGIGFYIDDVQNFTDQASRLVDLDRIEILKGPQGTLYGGSSIGGAVKYVTRKPSDEFEGKASVELGNESTFNMNGSVNIPLSSTFYIRVSGYSDTNDGYLKNDITHINNDKSEEYGTRVALRFKPSDETDINLSARYSYLNNGGNDYYLTSSPDAYKLTSNLDRNIYNHREVFGAILNVGQKIGDLSLTSLTSYTQRNNRILWDLDYSPADFITGIQHKPVKTKVFTQEARLQSNNPAGFNWLVGGYYSQVRDRSLVTTLDAVFGTDFTGGAPEVDEDFHNNTSLEQTYAGFATASYKAGHFEATLGGRLNYTDFFGFNRIIDQGKHVRDTVVLPKLTLSYKLDPAVMLYLNVSEGYEPGRFTLYHDTPLLPYKPEKALDFEAGAKGQTHGGFLSYEIAGFYIKSKNRQIETLVLDPTGVPNEAIGNVGNARTFGGEFAVALHPTRQLSLNANGGWMSSKFTSGDFDGLRVPYAPHFSGSTSIDYSFDLSPALKLSLRVDASHNSGFFWEETNTLRQKAYNLIGGRVALAASDDRWEIAVRADNMFNGKYHTEVQPWDDQDVLARRGQPRLIVGSATVKF